MTHEPECIYTTTDLTFPLTRWFFEDTEQEQDECNWCIVIRAAYKRGLGDAANAIQRVRKLHYEDDRGNCPHCSYSQSQEYPCPTIKALDGEIE